MLKKLRLSALLYLFASAIAFAAIATSTFANDTPLNQAENDSSHLVKSPSSLSLTALPDIQVCDTDQSGSEAIDLSALIPDILQGYANHSAAFYATQLGAENSDIAELIDHTVLFTINTGDTVTFFVRIQDNNDPSVFVVESLNISVGIGLTAPADYILCVADTSVAQAFNLTTKQAEIIADPTDLTITYHTSETDAQEGDNAITTPETYTNTTDSETIFVRVENADGCFATTSFDLLLKPTPVIAQPTDYILCDIYSTGLRVFNLQTKIAEILDGEQGIVTFHTTESGAQSGAGAIPNTTGYNSPSKTLYVRVMNAAGCYAFTTLELVVALSDIEVPTPLISDCMLNPNGTATFDLTSKNTEILNGETATITYHPTLAAAEANTAVINPANAYQSIAGSVYARVTHDSGCHVIRELQLLLGNVIANPVAPLQMPDSALNDGIATFLITMVTGQATYGNPHPVSTSFHLTEQDAINNVGALPNNYTNVEPYFQTIYIRVQNENNPACFAVRPVYLMVINLDPPPACPLVEALPVAPACQEFDESGNIIPYEFTLEASYFDVGKTDNYIVESIPYAPPFPFVGGGAINLPADDQWSDIINLGFDFCFFDQKYENVLVATNGAITFSIGGPNGNGGTYTPGGPSGWSFNQPIPNNTVNIPYRNSIFGVMQDLYPAQSPANHSVNYQILGIAPCRILVFNIYEMALFSQSNGCGYQDVGTQTSQIVLYETTNVIDVYIHKRTSCSGFNSGSGLVGIQNDARTIGITPPGRNTGTWEAFNEAWRFTPSGESIVEFGWYKDGVLVSTDPIFDTSVTESTVFVAEARYEACSGNPADDIIKRYPVYVEIVPELPVGQLENMVQCANGFDLDLILPEVMAGLNPLDVSAVNFYESEVAANKPFPESWPDDFPLQMTDPAAVNDYQIATGETIKTIYVRVENQNNPDCYVVRQFDIVIDDCTLIAPDDLEICDNDNDGIEYVDLAGYVPALNDQFEDDYLFTFYTSQADAIDGATNNIDTSVSYEVSLGDTVIWIRGENINDATAGIEVISFTITVNEAPEIEQNVSDYEVCESNAAGEAEFDLTTKETEILDGTVANVEYFTNILDAINGVSPITTPETYSSAGETIYVKATDANGCYSITSFELVINDDFQIEQDITDYELCDENGDGEEEFDLTTKTSEILGAQTATLTFYTSQANAQSGTDDIATPRTSTGEIIWVRAETADGCFDITSFLLVVKPQGNVPSPAPIEVCANNNAASVSFDLTSVLGDVMGAPTDVVTFHQTLAAAQAGTAAITPANAYVATANQTIYIRIVSQDDDICPAISSVNLVKLASPVLATTIADYELCDDGTGQAEFDLTSKETEILGATVATLTYYTSEANAIDKVDEITTPATYMSGSATIWVRAENANDCYTIKSFNLVLRAIPVANAPESLVKCNDGTGQAEFNLNSRNNDITGGAVGVVVTYHLSFADAESGDNPQSSPYTGTHQEILYVRVVSPFGCVNTTQTLELILEESTIAPILPELTYCDPNSDGWGVFDLTQIEQIINAANPNPVSITYHETIEDAEFLANIIDAPEDYFNIGYYTQTIYIAITPASGEACSSIAQVNLIVFDLPQITAPTPIETCDDDYDGFANFDLTIRNSEILNGLNPADYTIGYYPTEQDANLDTNAIANPTNYTNLVANQDSVWVRVTDINTGCFAIKELVLIVNPLPVVDMPNVAEYRLCDFGEDGYEIFDLDSRVEIILNGQTGLTVSFYQTYANAFDGVQAITNLMYQNQEQYVETLFVRVETQKGCFVVTLMDLVVDPLPVLTAPTDPIVSCDGDGDGYGVVNLEDILDEMLNGANPADFSITFHETYEDAQLNANSIDNPQEYYNIDPFNQVIYIRVESTLGSGCYNIYPINIEVVSAPVLPVEMDGTLPDLVVCDTNQDGFAHFDLTVQTAYILDQQTDITNLEVTYYISEQNAIDRALAIGNITNYPNISNPQTIWVVLENTLTGCFDIAAFDLVVNLPLDIPTVIPSITLCDEDGDLEVTFDLTVRLDAILANANDPNNYTVEFFYTYTDAINGNTTNLITDPTSFSNMVLGGGAVYTLGVRVTDNTTGCQSYALMDIRRAPMPNIPVVPLDPLEVCDNTNDDLIEAFDLTVYESFIRNGDNNVIITYHPTEADAEEGTNAIVDPTAYNSASTTIYIRVANKPNGGVSCAVILELELIVNPLPVVADDSFEICETNSSGYAEFYFPDFNPQLLGPTQDLADFTISYHLTQADAISGTAHIPQGTPYTNLTQFAEIIWTRITNNETGCVRIAEITLYAEEGAVANQPANPIFECDYDGTNDGITNTDLTQYEAEILGAQNPAQFIVTYYLTEDDANDATNAIINPENFTNTVAGGQTIYIRVENSDSNAPCYDVTQMEYIVEELAEPVITSPLNTICVDWGSTLANDPLVLDSNITAAGYSFEWYRNGTLIAGADQSTYTITSKGQEGSYYVIATSAEGCVSEVSNTFEVFLSGQATLVDIITENAFSDNQTITVIVEGNGQYVYQLDNGPIQQTGYFPNVTAGEHTVTVYDTTNGNINTINSCGTLLISDVQIIDYPRFFTPNGDGYNDLWNITGLTDFHKAEIYIFDRHGKLLKQLNPLGEGWNGTLNGNQLPATDYWFKVIYTENNKRKEFRAHFSLKR